MQLKLQDDWCVLQVALVHVKVVLGYFLHIGSQASAAEVAGWLVCAAGGVGTC